MNKCSVHDCSRPIKYKGLCGMHYKRQWRHGKPEITVIAPKGSNIGKICCVDNCKQEVHGQDLCKLHYIRKWRYGRTSLIRNENGTGGVTTQGYYANTVDGARKLEHIQVAEKALGKPLPKGAVVHHWDNNPLNNSPGNLLICPSQAYHMLIHKRMRQLAAKTLTLADLFSKQ